MTDQTFPCPGMPGFVCANQCTTGFAVRNGAGQTFMLSAAHCSFSTPNQGTADAWFTGDGGATSGGLSIGKPAFWSASPHDVMTIGPVATQGDIYACTSIADPGGQCSIRVTSASSTNVGDSLCTSGAFSGQICGLAASAIGVTIQVVDEHGNTVCVCRDMIQVDSPPPGTQSAGGNGDSGGPLFSRDSDGTAGARGTITAQNGALVVPCTGVPASSTRQCSSEIFVPDITRELADAGVSVLFG